MIVDPKPMWLRCQLGAAQSPDVDLLKWKGNNLKNQGLPLLHRRKDRGK